MKGEIYHEFCQYVNLTVDQLSTWLETEQSQSVGIVIGTTHLKKTLSQPQESIGHASGRRIVQILATDRAQLDADDYRHMKRVIAFIKRHSAQVPQKSDVRTSRWRYSLMNWGHDPLL